MRKAEAGRGPKDPDSALLRGRLPLMPAVTRVDVPEEELSTDEKRISLRVKVPAEDGTAVNEMTGPAAPENDPQSYGEWGRAPLEHHADGAADAPASESTPAPERGRERGALAPGQRDPC